MAAPREKNLHQIAVTGIIWRIQDGVRKYLAIKRAPHKFWANKWSVPGGGLEVEDYIHTEPSYANPESPQWYGALEKALRREIKEEVNLEVGAVEYLLDIAAIRPDGVPLLILSMYCEYESGEVVLDEDATEYAWITAAEAGAYDFVKGIDDEIRQVEARLAAKH